MDSAAVDSDDTTAGDGFLQLDSVPIVDLRLLSQSELYSLSLCSSSAFDPRRCHDVVIPKIDRSVFNESAGSRKQTYYRFRLAPSSSSSSAIPRRRTPHLRPTSIPFSFLGNSHSDPESDENIQIVNLLKQLFVADMNPAELVSVGVEDSGTKPPPELCSTLPLSYPSDLNSADLVSVEIDFSDVQPIEHDSCLPVSSPSNSNLTASKRKRGRLPLNDILQNEQELAVVISDDVDLNEDIDRLSYANEIVVWENMEDKDREVMNRDGVAVDLVALGLVEHPYVEEIRRRTEGLGTEEEFFTFLEGLNGQWGSRRKKKRIVDSSELGSALPIGWKLSLCIKKKDGQIQLYCRRYISPSGLHFVSCKGVSSYLRSLHGIQDTSSYYFTPSNEIVSDADKLISSTIADLPILDESIKQNLVSHSASPAFDFTSVNHVMEAAVSTVDGPQRQVGEAICCKNCNLTFIGEDELLLHQAAVHRRNRSRNGMRITDGVIIRDGKFECQFCHKIFNERHRYTGHVGAHVRYQGKNAGGSSAGGLENFENFRSFNELPSQDPMLVGSLNSDSAGTVCDEILNEQQIIYVSHNKNNEHAGKLTEVDGNARGANKAADEKKSLLEYEEKNVSAGLVIQDRMMPGNCLPSRPDDDTYGIGHSSVIDNAGHRENLEQGFVSKGISLDSKIAVEEYEVGNEPTLECGNNAVNRSKIDSLGSLGDQNKDFSIDAMQHTSFECLPRDTTPGSETSKLNTDPEPNKFLISVDKKACVEHNVHCSIREWGVDEACKLGTSDEGSAKADDTQFGFSFSTWNEQEATPRKGDTEARMSQLKDPGMRDTSDSRLEVRLEVLSNQGRMYSSENNDAEVCGRETEVDRYDDFQHRGNGELNDPLKSCHSGMDTNSTVRTYQDSKHEVSSAFAFDKKMFVEDNSIRIFNNVVGGQNVEPSLDLLFGQSGYSDTSDGGYVMDTVYPNLSSHVRLDESEKYRKHDLSLSFGDSQTELRTDSNRSEQGKYPADHFNIQSHVYKTYGDQAHLRVIDCTIPGDLKLGISQGFDLLDTSFNNRTHDPESSFNMSQPKRDWDGPRGDKVGTSNQNLITGIENNSSLSGEFLSADVSWRSSYKNYLQGGFATASGQQIPSSSHFRTFGVPTDKGEQDSFGPIRKGFAHSEMMRQGDNGPVEYSFMGEPSSSMLHGESKCFSYNANLGQEPPGLPFWLGKDALMPNAGSPMGQVTSLCVWCRNMLFHEPIQPGLQTSAVGTMCPSCSSKIPDQFKML